MIKRTQNKIAESRFTLPVTALYGVGIWLLCGLPRQQWWGQFTCFILTTYLMVELNNGNALIRIYSRSVSAAFIILSCAACFLFPSLAGAFAGLCFVASLLMIFHSYLDRESPGWTFYTFMFLSLGTLAKVHLLWFVPFYWVLMAFFVFSMSWRTFVASLIGLLLPYWCMATWVLWHYEGDFMPFLDHFVPLADIRLHIDYDALPLTYWLTFIFLVAIGLTGTIHYLRNSINDKIRIRQIFYSFVFLFATATGLLLLQPQHYDLLLRIMICMVSPLIGHFISLTNTRVTNIAFYVILGTAAVLTAINLWSSSYIF